MLPPSLVLLGALAISGAGFAVLAADRGEPVRLTPRQVSIYVREACARAFFMAIHVLGYSNPEPSRFIADDATRDVPVLLVPGHRMTRAPLGFMRTFLVNRGWIWVWPVNLTRDDLSLNEHAEHLARRVEQLRRATGSPRVDIVAFAVGGLVAAWYVKHLEGADKVRRLVTVATPWQGTRTAVFAGGRIGVETLYGSHVLDGLSPPPVETLCIWSPDDPVVVPSSSAVASGARSVCIHAAGHLDMLMSARVFRAVQAGLSHPLVELAGDG